MKFISRYQNRLKMKYKTVYYFIDSLISLT